MKKKEIIFFAVLFIAALLSIFIMRYINQGSDKVLLVTIDGEEYKTIELNDDTNTSFTVETEEGVNYVEVVDGTVNVVSADCPNQICVHTKEASEVGDEIVCLPHKVVIEIIKNE